MSHGDTLKLAYSIDFDGVLAESVWPDYGIGEPIDKNLEKLEEVREAGHETVIHSARSWSDIKKLETWLKRHGVPYDGIILGKYLAVKYVDDKAINSEDVSWI